MPGQREQKLRCCWRGEQAGYVGLLPGSKVGAGSQRDMETGDGLLETGWVGKEKLCNKEHVIV